MTAEQRRGVHAMVFGLDDDSYGSDDNSGSEFRSLYDKGPRLEPREQCKQIRRTLLRGGMVLLGCTAIVHVMVNIKKAQSVAPTPAPSLSPGLKGKGDGHFRVSEETNDEFIRWSEQLYEHTGLTDYNGGEPEVDWDLGHPNRREDRFPSVQQRIEYCMGRFHDPAPKNEGGVDMYGDDYLRDTYSSQRTTRAFTISSMFVVNLYGFDRDLLVKCDEEENTVLHTYCRDCVDFAILHGEMSAGAIQHMGDSLPRTSLNKLKFGVAGRGGGYPVFNKVRHYCDVPASRIEKYPDYITKEDRSPNCERRDRIDTILWPLNRHRHFTPAAQLAEYDVPWSEKLPMAIWRGGTNINGDALSDRKYALVSKHENSTLVDAKFAERNNKRGRHGDRTAGIPEGWLSGFLDKGEQLRYRYLISIEGNDVSSGLTWMLFSNSVVLLPPTTFESFAMEGLLEPYVHYIPIKSDMSNVESQILWAESNPSEAKRIADRSTLFIYDLLFHPSAMTDERAVLRGIAERYEENFGHTMEVRAKHPLGYIHWDSHPARREDRFPSVEERTRYCMGRWHDDADVDMSRKEGKKGSVQLSEALSDLDDTPKMNAPFIATGKNLEECPKNGPGRDDASLASYCLDSLPFFDERLIHDIVSTRHPDEDPSFKLAPETEDMTNSEKKWFKRILIDDSVKVLRFGEGAPPEEGDEDDSGKSRATFPVFAGGRRASDPIGGGVQGGKTGKSKGHGGAGGGGSATVLWRFGSSGGYDLVRSGLIERMDVPFESKEPRALWRGSFGTEAGDPDEGSDEFNNRLSLVKRSADGKGEGKVDARFVLPDNLLKGAKKGATTAGLVPEKMIILAPKSDEELADQLRIVLSFRYIVATDDEYGPNFDLKWMLLSRSVVLMPMTRRFATWFMENRLEPYVHFVPIKADYSDVEERVSWCEEHPAEAERIAERATLYVHDMLFHRLAAKEDNEVMFQIMERYAERLGGGKQRL